MIELVELLHVGIKTIVILEIPPRRIGNHGRVIGKIEFHYDLS